MHVHGKGYRHCVSRKFHIAKFQIVGFFLLSGLRNTTSGAIQNSGAGCGAEPSASPSARCPPAANRRPLHIQIVWTSLPTVLERSGMYLVGLVLRARHVYCCWMSIMFQIVRFKLRGCVDEVSIKVSEERGIRDEVHKLFVPYPNLSS